MTVLTQPTKIIKKDTKKEDKIIDKFFSDIYKQYDTKLFKLDNNSLIHGINLFSEYISSLNHAKSRFAVYLLTAIKNKLAEQTEEDMDLMDSLEIADYQIRLEKTLFTINKDIPLNRPDMRILAEINKKANQNTDVLFSTSPAPFEMAIFFVMIIAVAFGLFKLIQHFFF